MLTEQPSERVIYGCMRLGDDGSASVSASELGRAEAAIAAALETGIRTFDHADIYGGGKAELVFGEVLVRASGLRSQIILQSKVGIRPLASETCGMYDLRAERIRGGLEASLRRLRTDHLDLLLLHRPDPLMEHEVVASALGMAADDRLIARVGVSNMSGSQLSLLAAYLPMGISVNQLEMSLAQRAWIEGGVHVNNVESAEIGFPEGTIEYCRANRIQLQAWGSLAQGRFTGSAQSERDQRTAAFIDHLAQQQGTTPESIVLAWLQRHPVGIVPVIGTTDPVRIAACVDAVQGRINLSHEQWYELWLTARGAPLP